jgi:hypothetical protein
VADGSYLSAISFQLSAIGFQPKQEAYGRELTACTLAQSHCNPLSALQLVSLLFAEMLH